MNWEREIGYWRERLVHIVAMMLALAGIDDEFPIARSLPRYAYRAIMLILKPAESAVRRLIIVAASKLTVEVKAARSYSSPHRGEGGQPVEPQAKQAGGMRGPQDPIATPAFQLFDPRKRFSFLCADEESDIKPAPNFTARPSPDLPTIDDYLIPPDLLCDRLGFKRTIAEQPGDYEAVATTKLSLRLRALKAALDDIPGQALRLARLQARSKLQPAPGKRRYPYPKRPGVPPGYRKRRIHRIDEILNDCHKLAHRALEQKPDTS